MRQSCVLQLVARHERKGCGCPQGTICKQHSYEPGHSVMSLLLLEHTFKLQSLLLTDRSVSASDKNFEIHCLGAIHDLPGLSHFTPYITCSAQFDYEGYYLESSSFPSFGQAAPLR
jgi:hypothetical protein